MGLSMIPRLGAGIAVVHGRAVLLVRRGDNGRWDVPGGGAADGEPPEAAARRELREETGLEVGPLRPLGVFPHRHTYPDGNAVDWETHVFLADCAGGEPRASDDAVEVRWFAGDDLPQHISDATRAYFRAIQAELLPA